MIVIDTNIISELMKPSPLSTVMTWIDNQDAMQLFITTITIAEISYGINALPKGQRKSTLEDAFSKALNGAFKHRVLTFDEKAAHFYGKIMGHRKLSGRPMSIPDGQIAAIALTQECSVATRNARDFKDSGVKIINPFDE